MIAMQGTAANELLILLEGQIELRIEGDDEPLEVLQPGDALGESELAFNLAWQASAFASGPVIMLRWKR